MSSELFELPEAGASGPTVRLVAADGLPVESGPGDGTGRRSRRRRSPRRGSPTSSDVLARPRSRSR
ncbi:hypothetical protein IU11_07040 [Cellulosimicrobium sp. MM]|nr:hypothetical protein IU11_07040 [Cellulosimicrobium sp. MM]